MSLGYELETITYPHDESMRAKAICAAADIGSTIIRPAIHGFPKKLIDDTDANLEECLGAVDYYMDRVSSAIGGTTIEHRWVVADDSDARTKYGYYAPTTGLEVFGLRDMWLAAEVPVISGKPIKNPHTEIREVVRIRTALGKIHKELKKELGWDVFDIHRPEQLLSNNQHPGTVSDPILVDIDIT